MYLLKAASVFQPPISLTMRSSYFFSAINCIAACWRVLCQLYPLISASSKILPVVLTLFCFNLAAQTPISGSIGGMTFKSSGNPWLVTGNVFVEEESKTVVESGCVFLFKPYTGIVIEGAFIVDGEKDKPVVFTSINDTLYSKTAAKKPEPFDQRQLLLRDDDNYT